MRIPVAVLRDGPRATLLIIGPDNRHVPDQQAEIIFAARRTGDGLELAGSGLPVFQVDAEAELDLRTCELRMARARKGGVTFLDARVRIRWPGSPDRLARDA